MPEKISEGAEREAPRPPGVSMNQDKDADPGEAPDAVDRRERSTEMRSLPAPRSPISPPALSGPSPTVRDVEERTPPSEVSISPTRVYVTVELPGATRDAIDLQTTERALVVHLARADRPVYRLVVRLPVAVVPESAKATFRNGILDVTLERPGGGLDDR